MANKFKVQFTTLEATVYDFETCKTVQKFHVSDFNHDNKAMELHAINICSELNVENYNNG